MREFQALPADRIEDLRVQAAWSRQRRDLYRAKSYGPRATSPERMRELERQSAIADERLAAAVSGTQEAAPGGGLSNGSQRV